MKLVSYKCSECGKRLSEDQDCTCRESLFYRIKKNHTPERSRIAMHYALDYLEKWKESDNT